MSKNILVDAYNLTKILTSIRKYRKRATSIDMLIDVAFLVQFYVPLYEFFIWTIYIVHAMKRRLS